MKFNLKNRPRMEPGQPPYSAESVDKWFEGFEKKLRELLGTYDQIDTLCARRRAIFIREILGEIE